jgi:hypothetical protein
VSINASEEKDLKKIPVKNAIFEEYTRSILAGKVMKKEAIAHLTEERTELPELNTPIIKQVKIINHRETMSRWK